jgi:hypothetical protein
MAFKILAGVVAMVLMIAFLVPPIYKLKDVALASIVAIGIVMMLIDLWQSLQKDD